MNIDEMKARIAELESALASAPTKHRAAKKARNTDAAHNREVKRQEKAQRAQWRVEAWHRARLSSSLNRYKL